MRMNRNRGFTIVELMVGLAVSMIIVLAMMTLFKNTSRSVYGKGTDTTASVRGLMPSARQDGQLATALLTLQNKLQSAGFGISSAALNTNIVLITGATLSGTTLSGTNTAISTSDASGNALLWESNLDYPTGSSTCHGILSDSTTRAVYLLEATAPTPCNSLKTNWNTSTIVWSTKTLIEPNLLPSAITLTAKQGTGCSPYGISIQASSVATATAGLMITVGYANSSDNSGNTISLCLSNFAAGT